MRQIHTDFINQQTLDEENFSEIGDKSAQLEIEALNSTLEMMQVEFSVLKKEGAFARNISEKILIKDLKEWVHKNSQG